MRTVSATAGLCAAVLLAATVGATVGRANPKLSTTNPADWFTAANFTGVAAARSGTPDNVLFAQGFGTLDYRQNIPMPTDAHFPIASNTKVYVAISLYQLQERGLVNLSRTVQSYITQDDMAAFGYPNNSSYCAVVEGDASRTCQEFTFEQMLSMTACIRDNYDLQYMSYPGSTGLVFGRYLQYDLVAKPGSRYYYSNPSFILGAYFVEKFTGMSFRAYLKEYVHGPLGQKHTYFDPFNNKLVPDPLRVDEWYEFIDNTSQTEVLARGLCRPEFDMGSASGAGGIISNQDDEALLYFTLFNFSASSVGAPLFTKRESLIALVRPRTGCGYSSFPSMPMYYAQGLFVAAPNNQVQIPTEIQYEGEIVCSHTSNRFLPAQFDQSTGAETKPAVMAQAWSAVPVAYTSATAIAEAQASKEGSFIGFFARWPHRQHLWYLSGQLLDLFASE